MAISQDRLKMLLQAREELFRDDVTPDVENRCINGRSRENVAYGVHIVSVEHWRENP